ncbi:hypothetical protein LAWI1_G007080 [Lachnellula willkommii]|uniref:Uncharacterized protein n=1 Tax=Lachnellula willkommii TaxID=215461 RepID=A0A559M4X4_9HELO|nr:hypothetical protein LAWI1_G007080 [Lachnellula willkommii]
MDSDLYARHADFIETVTTLTRENDDESDHHKIQLIATKSPPIEMILTTFYTTAVVNIVSWDCAYSIFPDVTFVKKKTYQLKPLSYYYSSLLEKYHRRGWTCLQVPRDDDRRWTSSLQTYGSRRVGDPKCWKMELDTADVESGPPSSILELPFLISKHSRYDSKCFEIELVRKFQR